MDEQAKINTSFSLNHRYNNLNELPIQIIEHMRELDDEINALHYLTRLVTRENSVHLRGFIRAVVTNKEDHTTWGKEIVILLLDRSYKDFLTVERLELFNRPNSEFTMAMPLDFEGWLKNTGTSGEFAFLMPDAHYKSVAPKDYYMYVPPEINLIEIEEHQIDIQFRRLLASKLAGYLRHHNKFQPDGISTLDEVTNRKHWTSDALKALDGLLQEMKDGLPEGVVPGFVGPDEYYQ